MERDLTELLEKAEQILHSKCGDLSIKKTEEAIAILKQTKLDDESIIACYLFLPHAHGHISIEEIKRTFGEEMAEMLASLAKFYKLNTSNYDEAESLRKMFFAISKDVRVILVRLAHVVAQMRLIKQIPESERQEKCELVLALYAPLASRLGVSTMKAELENTAFQTLFPDKYAEIQKSFNSLFPDSDRLLSELKKSLQDLLKQLGIEGEVMGRKKHIYSIYKKLLAKDGGMSKIYDLIALRVIVKTAPECYSVLGGINSEYIPMPSRFKDWISIPKSNGYQSLHTTVFFNGKPIEVQIRTVEMHRHAEYGVAAHWMYKEKRTKADSLDSKLGWLRAIMEDGKDLSSKELLSALKVDIYRGEIFVQTPKGKVLHLPENATPIDFAYGIHTDVGHTCVGARVNNVMRPLTYALQNGDMVEILTSASSKGPSRDWLKHVKTMSARNRIRAFFKTELKEENIKLGKSALEQTAKAQGYAFAKLFDSPEAAETMQKYGIASIEELFAAVGHQSISANVFVSKLVSIHKAKMRKAEKEKQKASASAVQPTSSVQAEKLVYVPGLNNIMISFAGSCCSPVPGDPVVGFVSHGKGIVVHRASCNNVQYYASERLVEVEWKEQLTHAAEAVFTIFAINSYAVQSKISATITETKLPVKSFETQNGKNNLIIKVVIAISENREFVNLIRKIEALDGVLEVFRL